MLTSLNIAGADYFKYPRLQVLTLTEVIQHLLSASHRLRYLECFFPSVRRKFAKVPNIKFWKPAAFDFLESVVAREDGQIFFLYCGTVIYYGSGYGYGSETGTRTVIKWNHKR